MIQLDTFISCLAALYVYRLVKIGFDYIKEKQS